MSTIESLTHVVTKKSFEVEEAHYCPSGEPGHYYPLVILKDNKEKLIIGDVYAYHFFSKWGTVDHFYEVIAKSSIETNPMKGKINAWRCNKLTNLEVLSKIGEYNGTK